MQVDLTADDFRYITKKDIKAFLQTDKECKKAELVDDIVQLCNTDMAKRKELFFKYKNRFNPSIDVIEQMLQCNAKERLRWIKENKLPIIKFRPYPDNEYTAVVFDRFAMEQIPFDTIEKWRQEYCDLVEKHRQESREKAKATRQTKEYKHKVAIRKEFRNNYNNIVDNFDDDKRNVKNSLELAYWFNAFYKHFSSTMKVNTVFLPYVYPYRDTLFAKQYNLIKTVLQILLQFPWVKIGLYRPVNSSEVVGVNYCSTHKAIFTKKTKANYNYVFGYNRSKLDFYNTNKHMIDNCPHCTKNIEQNFRATICIRVKDDFVFYFPYLLIKDFVDINLMEPEMSIPQKTYSELTEDEKLIFDLPTVVKNINRCMDNFILIRRMFIN